MASDWLELDATDDWVRHDAEIVKVDPSHPTRETKFYFQALQQELAYASYLNVQTVILPSPHNRDHVASYARIVNSCLQKSPYIYLSIRLPIYNPSAFQTGSQMASNSSLKVISTESTNTPSFVFSPSEQLETTPGVSLNATWEMWDLIRSICDYNPRLTLSKNVIYCRGSQHL